MKISSILFSLSAFVGSLSSVDAVDIIPETDDAYRKRMQWFTDAQFGLFIHYGVYSTLGGEWKGESVPKYAEWIQRYGEITPEEYIPLAANFNPSKLDADLWVKTAKAAGMKYMVITSKHHEGFCLWDSAYTEYDIGEATDFDRDILGELKAACDKYGLKFGTYYSIIDWHHLSQRAEQSINQTPMRDKDSYVTYMKGQLKELIERYDPAVMWFDGDWTHWWTMDDGMDLYNYLRELSPDMIINNRVAKRGQFKKDYGTPENSTPGGALDHVWEACWTVNHSWGYKKSDRNWKSIDTLVQKQIDINAKGGNLLLNVGPYGDGSWPESSTELLLQMGEWNAAHSEAVYETKPVALPQQQWGSLAQTITSNADTGEVYAYVSDWPKNGKLVVKGLLAGAIQVVTYEGKPLPSSQTERSLEIDLSSASAEQYATVLRIQYSGGFIEPVPEVFELDLESAELILDPKDADLSGRSNLINSAGEISHWSDKKDTASWALNIPTAGKCAVKLLYSCQERYSGSTVKVTVGGKTVTAQVSATEGWNDFQILDLGSIELDSGATTFTIGFGSVKKAALFNLKSVQLIPVANVQ